MFFFFGQINDIFFPRDGGRGRVFARHYIRSEPGRPRGKPFSRGFIIFHRNARIRPRTVTTRILFITRGVTLCSTADAIIILSCRWRACRPYLGVYFAFFEICLDSYLHVRRLLRSQLNKNVFFFFVFFFSRYPYIMSVLEPNVHRT